MFFTSKRKKVAREVGERIWPFFGTAKMVTGHEPTHFKDDTYILGFVVGAGGYLARAASNNTLESADIGFVTTDVLENLFGKSGVDTAQRQMQLLKEGKAPEFQRGISNGQKTVLASLGAVNEMAEDLDVKAAVAEGGAGNVPATLMKRLFHDYVTNKYGMR